MCRPGSWTAGRSCRRLKSRLSPSGSVSSSSRGRAASSKRLAVHHLRPLRLDTDLLNAYPRITRYHQLIDRSDAYPDDSTDLFLSISSSLSIYPSLSSPPPSSSDLLVCPDLIYRTSAYATLPPPITPIPYCAAYRLRLRTTLQKAT